VSPTPLEMTQARRKWPRLVGLVAMHVGSTAFADRVVFKASRKEELYTRIVREAWKRRKVKQWQKKL
jgi:hypothetical protein